MKRRLRGGPCRQTLGVLKKQRLRQQLGKVEGAGYEFVGVDQRATRQVAGKEPSPSRKVKGLSEEFHVESGNRRRVNQRRRPLPEALSKRVA